MTPQTAVAMIVFGTGLLAIAVALATWRPRR